MNCEDCSEDVFSTVEMRKVFVMGTKIVEQSYVKDNTYYPEVYDDVNLYQCDTCKRIDVE